MKGTERYRLIDALRGACVISMVLYHMMYDIVYILGVDAPWYRGIPGHIWQQSICRTFIFIAGMSFYMSRSTLRRGIIISLCGAAVSAVTILADEKLAIRLGILTFTGAAYLIMTLSRPLMKRIPPAAGLVFSLLLFALTRGVPRGYLGFDEMALVRLPEVLYSHPGVAFFGFPSSSFHSADYFPLLPWIFMFAAGYFFWKIIKGRKYFDRVMALGFRPLEWIGRHAIIIYILHQPILYGISMAVCYCFH